MFSKENNIVSTIIFLLLFVVQYIVANTTVSMDLNKTYWLIYFVLIILISPKIGIKGHQYKQERMFLIICIIGALLTYAMGVKYGMVLLKILTIFTGYVGYLYMCNNKIDLRCFSVLFILLYIYFSQMYFSSKTFLVDSDNEFNLFGHSSSNLIPQALTGVLMFYYFINKKQDGGHLKLILLFSLLNFFFIIVQASRIGVLVSAFLTLIVLFDCYKEDQQYRARYIFSLILIAALSISKIGLIDNYILTVFDDNINNYEEDVRKIARKSFFEQLNLTSAFLGYPQGTLFGGLGRTFNAFLDFWSNYGLIPFLSMGFFAFKRIFKYNNYIIPLYMLIPLCIYSYIETLWGGTMWDIWLFIALFYSKKSIQY